MHERPAPNGTGRFVRSPTMMLRPHQGPVKAGLRSTMYRIHGIV